MQSNKPRLANKKKHLSLPIVLSVLVHAIILFFIFFTQKFPNKHKDVSVETALVTPEQLSNMQNNLKQNQPMANDTDTNNPPVLDKPQDPEYIDYASNQPDQTANANTDNNGITKKSANIDEPFEATPTDKQLEEFFIEAGTDDKPQDDVVISTNNRQQTANLKKDKNVIKNKDTHLKTTTPNLAEKSNSSGNTTSFNLVTAKIQRYLDKDSANNAIGKSITIFVEVYENGNVKNVKAVKGDEELFKKVNSAIYSAEPLPIDVNDANTYPIIELTLHGIK